MNTGSKKEDESFDWRQTSPLLAEVKVFGRNKEIDELRDKILVSSVENRSNGEKFSVVSIVGIGGVGKTTLAQWLFNREDVKNHFDLQAWVCTSGKSDMGTVMISIIEYATRSPYNLINFACIHEDLLKLLCEKRFLIVLDDVCDEIINQWGKLISVFRHGKEGSKIIITPRNRNVAGKVNSMDTIYLASFEGEEYWELIRCCAFGNVNPKDHLKLEDIGNQIASKLGGLPLAAKVVGGVLKERLEERHPFLQPFLEKIEIVIYNSIYYVLSNKFGHVKPITLVIAISYNKFYSTHVEEYTRAMFMELQEMIEKRCNQ